MARLHEVIGAVLRDIAQARVTSDLYSREISRSYERDAILRAFPAPRSEIMEVELELRFSILGVEATSAPDSCNDIAISALYRQLSDEIVRSVFARLVESSAQGGDLDPPEAKALAGRLKSPQLQQKFAEDIYYHLDDRRARLADTDQPLDGRQIARELQRILQRLLLTAAGPGDEPYAALAATEAGPVILRTLATYADQLARSAATVEASSACAVEVEVAGAKLQELPPSAVSTIKIKTAVRNYLWTHVGGDGATPIRQLMPE